MLWQRAKNLTIIFFVLLNILLAFFIYHAENQYVLSAEQENALFQVLKENKISWYFQLNRRFEPMRPMSAAGYNYDMERLLSILFDDPSACETIEARERTEYTDGTAWMVLSNGYISYNNANGLKETAAANGSAAENARSVCDSFIAGYFSDYRFDGIFEVENGLRLVYRQYYQQYLVYSNFIEFLVTESGIVQVDIQYSDIEGFNRDSRPICSPDEALLTFIQRIRVIYGNAPVLITQMDMVYYQDEFSLQKDISLQASPHYRIFIEDQAVPFLINAYNNTIR